MAAPKRKDVIERALNKFSAFVRVPGAQLESRRQQLLLECIDMMPPEDEGNWGLLLKTDKNPDEIESDNLVWRPTMQHIDVLSADKMPDGTQVIVPVWVDNGVIGKTEGTKNKVGKWLWLDPREANIPRLQRVDPPAPPLPPAPPPPSDPDALFEGMLLESLDRLADGIDGIKHALTMIADRIVKI